MVLMAGSKQITSIDELDGILHAYIYEAVGKDSKGEYVWDTNVTEASVRVELRGGVKCVKVNSQRNNVLGMSLLIEQPFKIAVPKRTSELRILLLKDKLGERGIIVFAACGIIMKDLQQSGEIEKNFDIFNPRNGQEAGRVRMRLKFDDLPSIKHNLEKYLEHTHGVNSRFRRRFSSNSANSSFALPTINSQHLNLNKDTVSFDENEEIRQLQNESPSSTTERSQYSLDNDVNQTQSQQDEQLKVQGYQDGDLKIQNTSELQRQTQNDYYQNGFTHREDEPLNNYIQENGKVPQIEYKKPRGRWLKIAGLVGGLLVGFGVAHLNRKQRSQKRVGQ